MKKRKVYIDMDGTIADLYNKKGWLYGLENEMASVFIDLKPLTTEEKLLSVFPPSHFEVVILSMTPKNASPAYRLQVIKEKNAWLDRYFPSLQKRIYKKYGYNKNLKNSIDAILVDDNEKIRQNFKGVAIPPKYIWE